MTQTARRGGRATPVLVLGSGMTALGVTRIFGRSGIPALLVAPPGDIASRSRWARRPPFLVAETDDPARLARYVQALPLDRAVLMPCSDSWAAAVASLPREALAAFPASVADPDVLRLLLDKARFAELNRHLGVPQPLTRLVLDEGVLDVVGEIDGQAFFLKPTNSQRFGERFGVKAFAVTDRLDAVRRWREARDAGCECLLQEYIPGPASAHVFVDGFVARDGRVLARFARRRLRMFPPDFGNSSVMVTVALSELARAVESVERILDGVGYHGIFSTELKYDGRDGEFKVLEVNARPWWYVEFAALCGVDVCGLAYRDALGLPVEPVTDYPVGSRYVYPLQDLRALWHEHREGTVGLGTWLGESLATLEALRRLDDPLPALARGSQLARDAIRRTFPS